MVRLAMNVNSNRKLSSLIIFPRKELIRSEEARPVRRHRPSPRIEHLSMDQILGLFAEAKGVRERDWLLFLVSFWHGLRASEAVSLTAENFADGYITVARLKGSLRTRQTLMRHENPLLDERAALSSWLGRHGPGRLFPISRFGFYYLVRSHGSAAGLPRHLCHPHIFKHSIAVHAISRAGVENVRQHLGHRSLSSTGEYLRVSDEAASSAVNQAVGLNITS